MNSKMLNPFLKLTVWLAAVALLLAACAPAEEPTPVAPAVAPVDTPAEIPTPDVTPVEEPLELPTPAVTPDPEVEPTPPDPTPVEAPPVAPEVVAPEVVAPEEHLVDMTVVARASQMVNMAVVNQANERVGDVSELLVDSEGQVRHVLFDVGGFLGIGARTAALAWEQFELRPLGHPTFFHPGVAPGIGTPAPGEAPLPAVTPAPPLTPLPLVTPQPGVEPFTPAEVVIVERTAVLVLPEHQQRIEQAPEIDMAALDRNALFWQPQLVNLEMPPHEPDEALLMRLGWFSGVFGRVDLVNQQQENLGSVSDFIVKLDEGQIRYAVVDYGGLLDVTGITGRSVLVPWELLEFDVENDRLILDVGRETMDAAPAFDWQLWRQWLPDTWDEEFRRYWNVETADNV
jgi:sporulation protein YlmC with PRC-barrel domain